MNEEFELALDQDVAFLKANGHPYDYIEGYKTGYRLALEDFVKDKDADV